MMAEDLMQVEREVIGGDKVTIATTSTQVVGPDAFRVALVLPAVIGDRISYSCGQPAADGEGLVIPNGADSIVLDRTHHGALVSYPWYAVVGTGTHTIRPLWSACHICQASERQASTQPPR